MTVQFHPRELFYPRHLSGIAEILLDLAAEVEALGGRLCADPALVENHAQEMQAFDLVAQMQQELAALLTAECPACAADKVRLDSLRDRLQACLPHVGCGQ